MLADDPSGAVPMAEVRSVFKSQYHAGLAMLRQAVELCPDDLWLDAAPRNAFWQIAYHALFFTHLYLMPREEEFVPWEGHVADVQNVRHLNHHMAQLADRLTNAGHGGVRWVGARGPG